MNVVIEAAVATCEGSSMAPRVLVLIKYAFDGNVSAFLVRPAASITRFFSQGSTSLSAVSPDNYFNEGGLAVA